MRTVERNALVERYLPFIKYLARRMRRKLPSFEYDDLVQIGTLAFIELCDRVDPVGIDNPDEAQMFRSYAAQRICGAIMDAARRERKCPNKRVPFIVVPLDEDEWDDGKLTATDDPEAEALRSVQRVEVFKALPEPRHRQVVDLWFFRERTLAEIAGRLGVTTARISQIKRDALAKLRRSIAA